MRELVGELCSDACEGRAAGSAGGRRARGVVLDAMRGAGLDVEEQAIPGVGGANLIARVPGRVDRWVMVAAHYDHLGKMGGQIYRGADDNAASVAIMVEVARRLVQKRADGRGVIFAAFDAEEPPFFLTSQMGSEVFCRENRVEAIDMMVCLELVGHSLGAEGMPAGVRESLFALGAERSEGTAAVLEGVTVNGVEVRRADAEIIPPLSDYAAFWERERPFLLLTGGRSRRYHTPADGVEGLDWGRMAAVGEWLEQFVRRTCEREGEMGFRARRDDRSTLESVMGMLAGLAERSAMAAQGLKLARELRGRCREDGTLRDAERAALERLVMGIEGALG